MVPLGRTQKSAPPLKKSSLVQRRAPALLSGNTVVMLLFGLEEGMRGGGGGAVGEDCPEVAVVDAQGAGLEAGRGGAPGVGYAGV